MGGRAGVGAAIAVWAGLLASARLGLPTMLGIALLLPPFALVAWRGPDRVGTLALLLALALGAAARGSASHAALERARAGLREPDTFMRIEGRIVEPPLREAAEPIAIVAVEGSGPPLAAGARLRLSLPAG